jgi:Caspase domain
MSRLWHTVLTSLIIVTIFQSTASLGDSSTAPIYLYASQTGRPTLDQGEGGGNPFASALVELLGRKSLTFEAFRAELIELTQRKSRGFQQPEVQAPEALPGWQLLPKPETERRVALVLVFSDYSPSGKVSSLPGAKHDMQRVAAALDAAGFEVQRALDPTRAQLEVFLQRFAHRSEAADVAVLYATGHGVEVERVTYLLPGDYPAVEGTDALAEHALRLTALGSALRARRANLLFYGGCRNNPMECRRCSK